MIPRIAIPARTRYPDSIPPAETMLPVNIGNVVIPIAYTAWKNPMAVDFFSFGSSPSHFFEKIFLLPIRLPESPQPVQADMLWMPKGFIGVGRFTSINMTIKEPLFRLRLS